MWTHEQAIPMIRFMFEVDPISRHGSLGLLKDLDCTGWIKEIWATPVTSWNSAILQGEIADAIQGTWINLAIRDLKVNQSIGAWPLDCAFAEAKVRLSFTQKDAQYNGVPKCIIALLEVEIPQECHQLE